MGFGVVSPNEIMLYTILAVVIVAVIVTFCMWKYHLSRYDGYGKTASELKNLEELMLHRSQKILYARKPWYRRFFEV